MTKTMNKLFYRVSNIETQQGLWYDFDGIFTGLIHDKFAFCTNKDLKMDFDETIQGYLSAVPTLENLYQWFTFEDIIRLQEHNYFIHVYEADDYKFYDRFQHHVINQHTSRVITRLTITQI